MADSFTAETPLAKTQTKRRRVLVTGATGNIGAYFAQNAYQRYDLRLMVRDPDDAAELERFGEVVITDLNDLEKLKEFCREIDTVVHMAGQPNPSATWNDLLEANIIGSYNLFVSAKAAGCRRVIFASSIHAVSGYPADVQVKTNDPVNPGDLYGVSKCFGEAMGRYMAEQEGLSVIALRIGAFQPLSFAQDAKNVGMLDAWVSHRDLQQLIEKCIDAETIRFAIFNGLSDNRFKRLDISDARELVGYAPVDDLTEINPRIKDLKLDELVLAHNLTDKQQTSGIRDELG